MEEGLKHVKWSLDATKNKCIIQWQILKYDLVGWTHILHINFSLWKNDQKDLQVYCQIRFNKLFVE